MIILDFETNTHNVADVIEVAAVRIDKNFNILDKFHRYYLSRYPVNYYSYAVHRLTPELIMEYRKDKDYSSYFSEDLDFIEFCSASQTLIAHNISFELKHLNRMVYFSNHICTMKENKSLVKALNKNGNIKNPSLTEVCEFFKIDFDEDQHHSATYDVSKTYEILKKMDLSF
jgi:DNA polymerase-3 subunit epsilon